MNDTWWKQLTDLDDEQRSFVSLPPEGRHVLVGPPGCGKTNLLLLRAKYLYGQGLKNLLFLTYANCLADFIRSGLGDQRYFEGDQVQTIWSWARGHILTYTPGSPSQNDAKFKKLFEIKNDDNLQNKKLAALIKEATDAAPTHQLYDAIFIDEVQDISHEVVEQIARLAERVTVGGDDRQALYAQDGLKSDGFQKIELKYHYRIGRRICEVADKLLPPTESRPSLLESSLYDESKNESDARLYRHESIDAQFNVIIERLGVQVRAFPGELLGIFLPTKDLLAKFAAHVEGTDLEPLVAVHAGELNGKLFSSGKPIHVLTVHGAKGAEFRAVHIAGSEALKFPLHRREIIFTAVTRAKTSLSVHCTGKVSGPIESAFAERTTINVKDLF